MKAETMQIGFDLAGVALSAGSACSSGKVGPSHVLKAMGFGDNDGALRVSIGHRTGESDIELFRTALTGILARRAGRATKAA
jgi:cysteine desulfurase